MTMMSGVSSRTAGDVGTDRFTKLAIGVTIVVVLVGAAAQLINYGFFDQRIQALDAASDGGVVGAIGDIALAAAAVSAWILAARVRSARSVSVILAALLTFVAADKVVGLHDHTNYDSCREPRGPGTDAVRIYSSGIVDDAASSP